MELLKVALFGPGFSGDGWDEFIIKCNINGKIRFHIVGDNFFLHDYSLFDLGIAINLQKILPSEIFEQFPLGVWVTHSSDLPLRRGWSPLFHTIHDYDGYLNVTLFKICKAVDSGLWACKSKLKINSNWIEREVRLIDKYLNISLYGELINRLISSGEVLVKQIEKGGTYCSKRTPEMSLLSNNNIWSASPRYLIALPDSAPGFLQINGRKIFINLTVEDEVNVAFAESHVLSADYYWADGR